MDAMSHMTDTDTQQHSEVNSNMLGKKMGLDAGLNLTKVKWSLPSLQQANDNKLKYFYTRITNRDIQHIGKCIK